MTILWLCVGFLAGASVTLVSAGYLGFQFGIAKEESRRAAREGSR